MEIYRTAVAIFFGEIIDCRVTTQVNPRALGIRYQYQVLRKPSPRLGANLLDVAVQEGAGPITICRRPGRSRAHNLVMGPAPSWTATESSNSVPNTKENLITSHNQP